MCNIIYRQVTEVFLPREMQLSCQMFPLSSDFFLYSYLYCRVDCILLLLWRFYKRYTFPTVQIP